MGSFVELSESVPVPETPETVWAAATDWVRQHEWMPNTEVYVTRGEGRLGAELIAFTSLAGVGFVDRMEIVEWQPVRHCRVRHIGRLLRGEGGFDVVRRGPDTSTFVWWERLSVPRLGGAVWPVARPAARWILRASLTNFASFCQRYESGE